MKRITLPETASTNSWVAAHASELDSPTCVRTISQTAGRGQRGNIWEAAPGKNLTLSIYFVPPESFHPRNQFLLSELTAIAVCDALAVMDIDAKVKWPNDIYVGDYKICGILIEHSLMGERIQHSIAGIGLNVNQETFLGDAPNPVSMKQLLGVETDLDELCLLLETSWQHHYNTLTLFPEYAEAIHKEFLKKLWRGDGKFYPFSLPDGTRFMGRIVGIEPSGIMEVEYWYEGADMFLPVSVANLRYREIGGKVSRFAFKEVTFELF